MLTPRQTEPNTALSVAVTALGVIVSLFAIRFMLGKAKSSSTKNFRSQGLMLLLTVGGVLIVILSTPDTDASTT